MREKANVSRIHSIQFIIVQEDKIWCFVLPIYRCSATNSMPTLDRTAFG